MTLCILGTQQSRFCYANTHYILFTGFHINNVFLLYYFLVVLIFNSSIEWYMHLYFTLIFNPTKTYIKGMLTMRLFSLNLLLVLTASALVSVCVCKMFYYSTLYLDTLENRHRVLGAWSIL